MALDPVQLKIIAGAPAGPARPLAVEPATPLRLDLLPGERVAAEVVEGRPDGRFLVRLGGELLDMNLPATVRPGETLTLTYLGERPRPTFLLSLPGEGGEAVDLSGTGRWLGRIAPHSGEEQPSAAVVPGGRLLAGVPADPKVLAGRLREVLVRSGLFYESHLAAWAVGEGKLADLLEEPQGRLSPRLAGAGERDSAALQQGTAGLLPSPGNLAAEPADGRTHHLIREQLALLQTGRFSWQGEAWPGQELAWGVGEREAEGGAAGGREWETSLALELPRLGPVRATLRLRGGNLQLDLQASQASTAAALENGSAELRGALEGTGLRLTELTVHHAQAAP